MCYPYDDWRHVQGVSHLLHYDSRDKLQQPVTLKSIEEKRWMDEETVNK